MAVRRNVHEVKYVTASVSAVLLFVVILVTAACFAPPAPEHDPPYPYSDYITGISFDWSTYQNRATGSDNWPMTWASDDHQYTSWGDGGGFGGTNSIGRVSLGFARIEGSHARFTGVNVWGGHDSVTSDTFGGKSYGMLAIGNTIYTWRCGEASQNTAFHFQRLYRSTDGMKTWEYSNWEFPEEIDFYCPTFLQFGKGYSDARDRYVYMYAAVNQSDRWEVHRPGEVVLFRAPSDELMTRSAYEFFSGFDANDVPRWSRNIADRKPIWQDRNGLHLVSVIYNAGLDRYLLATTHAGKNTGNIGIFEAPEPWGPWRTVLYEQGWGSEHIDPSSFFWNFSPKWWSNGGKDFVLVFTGRHNGLDAWNSVAGSFEVAKSAARAQASPAPSSATSSASR